MRTTVNLDENAYNLALSYANSHKLTLSQAINRLILKRPTNQEVTVAASGIPQFRMDKIYSAEQIQEIINWLVPNC